MKIRKSINFIFLLVTTYNKHTIKTRTQPRISNKIETKNSKPPNDHMHLENYNRLAITWCFLIKIQSDKIYLYKLKIYLNKFACFMSSS